MRLTIAILSLAALAWADVRTFPLSNTSAPVALQEMATGIRTVTGVRNLKIDPGHPAFTLDATPAQLDAAAWLIQQLDKPDGWQPSSQERLKPSTLQFQLRSTEAPAFLRLHYLPARITAAGMQESQTALRTILDIRQITGYRPAKALVYQGSQSQIQAVEWLLNAIQSPGPSLQYAIPDGGQGNTVRVFLLPPDATVERMRQLGAILRVNPIHIDKEFVLLSTHSIAVRGTPEEIAQAEKAVPHSF